jgi:[CysO sulfur-carrier protein]-S-L-cysteine hydrolase
MLELDQDHYQALVAHARAEYPNEACALLAGRDGAVDRVYALPNAEASPTFYVVEPRAQLRAMTEMDDLGLDLVGIFHSHVATEAFPSRTDVELAAYPDAAYLILSLADPDAPVLRAFRIRDGRVDEEPVEVEGSGEPQRPEGSGGPRGGPPEGRAPVKQAPRSGVAG